MVFKLICLLFYIVDVILTVIDVTRSFIISRCKLGGGKNVKVMGLLISVVLNLNNNSG